jgi:YVTN family beta-propeller protein
VALVTQLDGRSVTKLNIAGPPTVVSQITVNDTPTGISVTPNGATAFVANQYDYSIGVIDVAAGQQTKKFPFQATTFRTLVSRDGSRAYWTTSGGELTSYNVSTSAIISTRSGFGIANGLALGLGDSTLFVSSMDGTLSAVDVKSGALIRSVTIPNSTLQDVAVSPAGDEIYVADERGRLLIISPALGISTALSAPGAFGVALSPDGTQLWVTQPTATTITVVDRATHTILKTITGLGWPRRVAFDRFGAAAVVTDEAGAVHVFR